MQNIDKACQPDQAVAQHTQAGGEGAQSKGRAGSGSHLQKSKLQQGRSVRDFYQGAKLNIKVLCTEILFRMISFKICDNCEVDYCSGACALFYYEDQQVCCVFATQSME